jgi:hypothetical protein
MDWMIGLTPHTCNSGLQAIIALPLLPHPLQFAVTYALGFSVFTSSITVSLSLQITHELFPSQPNSFLAIILQLPIPKTRVSSNSSAPKPISRQAGVPKLNSSLPTTVL